MHAWRIMKSAAAGVVFLLLLGLLHDALEGLPLTRNAPTSFLWIGGLFLGGLSYVASSLLFERGAEPIPELDRVTDPLGRRIVRAAVVGTVIGIAAIVWLIRFVPR